MIAERIAERPALPNIAPYSPEQNEYAARRHVRAMLRGAAMVRVIREGDRVLHVFPVTAGGANG